ncbi:MAG: four helix bundle protein [Gammaproteobacteria bacterium]
MRDHKKLRAFELADSLAVEIYRITANFPKEERYGLSTQMRRAAVSIASNIVEGCARHSEAEYLHFLVVAYGSARELEYQVSLARRLGFIDNRTEPALDAACDETCRVLNGLIHAIRG